MGKKLFIFVLLFLLCGCNVDKLQMSDNMLKQQNYASATKWANKALTQKNISQNEKLKALFLLGLCFLLQQDNAKAESYFKEMLLYSKNNYKALFFLGVLAVKDNNFRIAIQLFSKSAKYYNNFPHDQSYYDDLEYATILFYEMMCSFAIGDQANAENICYILKNRHKSLKAINSWCLSVCKSKNLFEQKNNKDAHPRIMLRSNWNDAITYYFKIPILSQLYSKNELIRIWLDELCRPSKH